MITPARQQYLRLKAQHPDALLLYRLGDFYEAFDEDAHTLSQVLNITLTSRSFGRAGRVPMAGIPHHALHGYLRRLLRAGLRVAIGEQVSEAGHGLVEREIVRVLSSGTVDDPALLDASRTNYLLALAEYGALLGMAWVDVSTGACEYHASPIDDSGAINALVSLLAPAEVIAPEGHAIDIDGLRAIRVVAGEFAFENAAETIGARFPSVDAPRPAPLLALVVLITYLERGQADLLDALETPLPYAAGRIMALDRQTRTNLEIDLRIRGRSDLFGLLNATRTAPGARLLRSWLHRPLVDRGEIEARLDAVEALSCAGSQRLALAKLLEGVRDLERLATRAQTGGIRSQELASLAESLERAGQIQQVLRGSEQPALLAEATNSIDPLPELRSLIEATLGDGDSLFQPGADRELDDLYSALEREHAAIKQLEREERERTGIRALKTGYNKVFGYYFEVSRANRHLVPVDAERKQSLTNAERYITLDLRAAEARANALDARVTARESALFANLVGAVAAERPRLRATAAAVATIDVLNALAAVAVERKYVRPVLREDTLLLVHEGRHPIVERELPPGMFIPNDAELDDETRLVVLTGPNMAGKSTWLRQTALIVLLAQIGSFVPADRAEVGLVDRIFTRIGAHDDLARGQSTFMVEMLETATILRHATERSLVVLDEVGRGTSTEDGVAIATAVVEHLAGTLRSRTLFATHFRELAHSCSSIPATRAMQTAVARDAEQIVFLHTVVPGVADAALGLEIARLAGIPGSVLERARSAVPVDAPPSAAVQTPTHSAVDLVRERVVVELLDIDVATTTPLQALIILAELQGRLRASASETLGPRVLEAAESPAIYGRAD